jgi:ADP-heptose:LPS heptosyltransferase
MKTAAANDSALVRDRICAIFPGALGDFVCFLPALRILARDVDVDLFARGEFATLVPRGVAARSLERPEVRNLFVEDEVALESLQGFFGAYSAVYSWLGSQQKEFVRRLQRVAPGKARIFPFAPTHARLHQTDYYLGCLNLSSLAGAQPVIELNRHEAAWCDEFFSLHDLHRRPILAMAAGSGAREKNWPEEFFLAVAEWWRDRIGGAVVLLVGPVEEERGGIERLDRQCVVARGLNLSQIAALIARSHVYLGNDSGISHIAAATGVRSVVLFGPSAAEQWAPRGQKVEILSRNIECSPCSERLMKNCWHRSCLTAFESKEVISFLAHLPEVLTLTRARPGITV